MTASSFRFEIEGQPPSVNHLHRQVWRTRPDGTRYKGRAKDENVAAYQLVAMNRCKAAIPAGWKSRPYVPSKGLGLIVIRYWFYLAHAIDVDNTFKALDDAIKFALRMVDPSVDDNRFLPQAWGRETGHRRDARTVVEVEPL